MQSSGNRSTKVVLMVQVVLFRGAKMQHSDKSHEADRQTPDSFTYVGIVVTPQEHSLIAIS